MLGTVAAVTGPTDYVSDGERVIAVSNGHELLGTVSGTGCMSTAITGAFLAAKPDHPLEAAARRSWRSASPARTPHAMPRGRVLPRAALRRALQPRPGMLDSLARVQE